MTVTKFQRRATPRHAHRATVRTVSPRTHTERVYEVTWRQHALTCCDGKDWPLLIVEDKPPVLDFDTYSDGGLMADHVQCGTCGTYRSARATIRKVDR